MKHIRGPNPKIFGILIALCFVALCVPANAMADQSANNMIPAGDSNLATFNSNSADNFGPAFQISPTTSISYDLNSAAALAIPITACMKEGNVYRATNSTWRLDRLNAANSNLRPLYMTSMTTGDATFPRKTVIPLLV